MHHPTDMKANPALSRTPLLGIGLLCHEDKTYARCLTSSLLGLMAALVALALVLHSGNKQKIKDSNVRAEVGLLMFLRETTTAIIEVAPDSSISGWDSSAASLFGYTASEVVGKKLNMLLPTEELGTHHEGMVRFGFQEEAHTYAVKCEVKKKDGSLLPVSVRVFLPADKQNAIVLVSQEKTTDSSGAVPPHPSAHNYEIDDMAGIVWPSYNATTAPN